MGSEVVGARTAERYWQRLLAILAVSTLIAAFLGGLAARPAAADSAPADPSDPTTPVTVSADALPTAQINGVVWSQVVVGDRVYAGGNFSSARPPGAAAGVSEVSRGNLMSYTLSTGQIVDSFAPVLNGQVRTVAVSPDKSRLYVGGTFTTVNGSNRSRIAAFDLASGQLVANFAPPINYDVYSIVATNTKVFVGGDFQGVGSRDRGYLAAFDAGSGSLLDWAPQAANGKVWALALNPTATKLAVGGQFTTLNGSANPGYGLGMVDTTTGASLPMSINSVVRNGGSQAGITSLSTDGDTIYGSGYTFGAGGTLEGVFGATWDGGQTSFVDDCHGDVYSTFPRGGAVYATGHSHYCGNIGGFPQTTPDWTFYRGVAFGKTATGTAMREPYGYHDFSGQPTSALLTWYPSLNAGTFTGQAQGPWSVSGNDDYVVMGGEFTRVNNKAQQGLVRFPKKELSPNAQGPNLFGTSYPLNVSSTEAGKARINWGTNADIDNDNLTYRVYRDVQQKSGLVYQSDARANFWNPYTLGFTDSGLQPGSTHQYRVAVSDPAGNIANSPWATVTVASSGTDSNYLKAVYSSQPTDFWRFGETAGTTASDRVGFSPLTQSSGVAVGGPGALAGDSDKAAAFDGTENGVASTGKAIAPPNVFSLEGWFKADGSGGGKMIGFGDRPTGTSSNYDRHLYLDNSGHVVFGVYDGSTKTVTSPASYGDGGWHYVVGTIGKNGMKLYVDGGKVGENSAGTYGQGGFWGYWRVGGDNLGGWPATPVSGYFKGSLDEMAVYSRELSSSEIYSHFAAGTGANVPPVASFKSVVNNLSVDVDGSASTDTDGTVATYAWDFGDGSLGSGAQSQHVYSAAGTYPVTLTVTDNLGATASITQSISVARANASPVATYAGTTTGLDLALDGSASSDPDGTIVSYAWDFGDGTTGSGATTTHSFAAGGTYGVTLTVVDDRGASNRITKQITVIPPNVPPRAAFAMSVNQLVVTADASGSSDPDGSVASYGWDFGDSATASGVTATHSYAKAGSYSVTLLVTDNGGATDRLVKQVTVAGAQAPFAADKFNRTVTGGWGSADAGGSWVRTGSATNFSTAAGTGNIRLGSAGAGPSIALPNISSSDTDLQVQFGVDKLATGGGTYVTLQPRLASNQDGYYADARLLSDGTVTLALGRRVSGSETTLQTKAVSGLVVGAGDQLNARVQAFGTSPTTLRVRVWKVGSAEPSTWNASVTDSTATLQVSSGIGLGTYLSSTSTNAPVVVSFTNLTARKTS